MKVVAKFTCNSVRKYKGWHGTPEFLYEYEFTPVAGSGSDEDKSFFASTPSGSIKMSAVGDNLFEPGKSYYVRFEPEIELVASGD